MSTSRMIRFLAVMAGVAMLAVACGGGSDDSSSSDTSGDSTTECPERSTSPNADGLITLEGTDEEGTVNCFSDTTLEVTAGEEVTVDFVNSGSVPHTFTIEDWDVDTDLVDPGESKSVSFTVPADASGETQFICIPHESLGMVGVLNVS